MKTTWYPKILDICEVGVNAVGIGELDSRIEQISQDLQLRAYYMYTIHAIGDPIIAMYLIIDI
jgi:hypothetical protein